MTHATDLARRVGWCVAAFAVGWCVGAFAGMIGVALWAWRTNEPD